MKKKITGYLRFFSFSLSVTLLICAWVGIEMGLLALFTVVVLVALELTFSFDNAVVNAKIVRRMSEFWQKIFLSVGIIIAVLGMRVVFPILVVALSAQLPIGAVLDLAVNDPHGYARALEGAHPSIAAFGGVFLLMLCFSFMFDRDRQTEWIPFIERPLKQIGHPVLNTAIVSGIILAISAIFFSGEHTQTVALSGFLGMVTYLVIHLLVASFDRTRGAATKLVPAAGLAGFYSFMYLELIDASFSFDGVIGAFAITDNIVLIAAGLGAGAVWVRSLTVYMVRKGTLDTYRYLDHGAHYAIGALALTLLFGITLHVPEYVSGSVGIAFIGASFIHSLVANKKERIKV